jgi:hypothetical protein
VPCKLAGQGVRSPAARAWADGAVLTVARCLLECMSRVCLCSAKLGLGLLVHADKYWGVGVTLLVGFASACWCCCRLSSRCAATRDWARRMTWRSHALSTKTHNSGATAPCKHANQGLHPDSAVATASTWMLQHICLCMAKDSA